jgi:magnesium transporter
MLSTYDCVKSGLSRREGLIPVDDTTVWFDLINPTVEEEAWVEQVTGIDVPTREDVREIEASNRFYEENGAVYMTAFIVYKIEDPTPLSSTVTFILVGNRLVTVRYCEPKAFPIFVQRAEKGVTACNTGPAIMMGLVETLIQRKADLIERIQDAVDKLAQSIFNLNSKRRDSTRRFDVLLRNTGKEGDVVSRALESATSLDRLLHYFQNVGHQRAFDPKIIQRIDIAQKDITSLNDHIRFLTTRIGFLLEATLGMISTEQNQIIKLFSVMAVMLMPPTLVASVYGMNFKHMPELEWPWGYPMALGLMLISAIIPFIYFKRKGWL